MPEAVQECTGCDSTEIVWIIKDKPWCVTCAAAQFEIQGEPFDDE